MKRQVVVRPSIGIISLFYDFLRELARQEVRKRIAPLQLVGKLEDYLVKDLASFTMRRSSGSRYCESNSGRRGQQKIDLAVVRRAKDGTELVEALIEAKYLRNRHRVTDQDGSARDETRSTLADLARQLAFTPRAQHGQRAVRLRARGVHVYGLVFGSYTRPASEPDRKHEYYESVLSTARDLGLRYHDLERPYWRLVYEDVQVSSLGQRWLVTLQAGLWKTPAVQALPD